jgi:hypothetical protein
MNFEDERRKRKLSREDYASIQQPYDRKGKVNPIFIQAFGEKKLPKKKV